MKNDYFVLRLPISPCLSPLNSLTAIDTFCCIGGLAVTLRCDSSRVRFPAMARIFVFAILIQFVFTFLPRHISCHELVQFLLQC